jgi:ElaB/YqjD/DUF883 family membrane-anchored ribosome-binding protein
MVEKADQLDDIESVDPFIGRLDKKDLLLKKYGSDEYPITPHEIRELAENTGPPPEETEHIKAQIEETRTLMGETIDAIQEKLSFANVSEQVSEHVSNAIESAKDTIYDATIGKAVTFMKNTGNEISNSNVIQTVRSNPLPLLLIGLGAGLLAYQSYSGGGRKRSGNGRFLPTRVYSEGEEARVSEFKVNAPSSEGTLSKVTDKAGEVYNKAASTAGETLNRVTGAVGEAYSEAGELARRAYDTAGEYGNKAYETYDRQIHENPLAVAAAAAAIGAVVGWAIPATRFEGELMGEARENFLEKAHDAAGKLVEKAKHVADETGRTIKEETRTLGH